jgi:hypothetical protein
MSHSFHVGHEDADILEGPLGQEDGVPARRWAGRRGFVALLVLVGLAGLLAGVVAGRVWTARQPSTSSAREVSVEVSLAADVGGLLTTHDGLAIVEVSTVMQNTGSGSLSLVAIKVTGPGAGDVADPALAQVTTLPVRLPPGQFVHVHFALTSDCAVVVRPAPRIVLVVRDASDQTHEVATRIPDLDSVWGQSLLPEACPVP